MFNRNWEKWNRLEWFIFDLKNGLREKYPLCCILYFCRQHTYPYPIYAELVKELGLKGRIKEMFNAHFKYVPCKRCAIKYIDSIKNI